MQGRADLRPFQNSPQPLSLVRGHEERLSAKDRRVGPVDDIVDFANGVGRGFVDSLDMQWDEK
jgi:hypothetical protein